VSLAFGQAARDAGIAASMGSKGCAYDNAVAESCTGGSAGALPSDLFSD
jgi:transposase InsO family protein